MGLTMVEVRHCPFKEVIDAKGFDELVTAYSTEPSIKNKDLMSPNPQLDTWLKLEEMDMFLAVGAFDGDKVVGIIGYTAYVYPLSGDLVGAVDPYFLMRPYRNTRIGTTMRTVLEGLASQNNLKGLFYGAPKGSALSKQYAKFYQHTNEVFWCNLK